MRKAARALATDGPTFLNVVSPCTRGWRAESADGMGLARLATESCYWPLFEVEDGRYRLSYRPRDKRPVAEWLDQQGRFSHLARPGAEQLVERLQHRVDDEWDLLLRTCDEIPEAQRQTTRDRRSCKVRAVQAQTHSGVALGEPLAASMTSNTIDWGEWGAMSSALSWGVVDD